MTDVPVHSPVPAPRGTRVDLACRLGQAVSAVSRLTGRGAGGVIGGRAILRLAPDATRVLATGREVILVSGTNGKTTTSALLSAALRTAGAVASNTDGANTPAGFVTTLAQADADRVVLETDEGWLPWAAAETGARTAVLLNLTRDQLHRHHEVRRLAARWHDATDRLDLVVANADDPDVVWAAEPARRQVWVAAGMHWKQDSVVCPRCGDRQLWVGDTWGCGCGLRRPTPDWWLEGGDLVSATARVRLDLALPGEVNRGNAALAVATAVAHGVDPQAAADAMREVAAVIGRYDVVEHAGRQARLVLAKNPASWLEAIDLVGKSPAPLVLAFNSEGVDGRDPSWLYDVPLDRLMGRGILVVGRRVTDMIVRLEMAGIDDVRARPTLRAALESLPLGPVDVVANYTAFQEARRELSRGRRR
ncbi:MAG: MurT ligase domain-containing protein [Nocardioidaceae bacterium]